MSSTKVTKPTFTINRSLLHCPTTPIDSITGCGSFNLSELDDEGLIDCFDCGIWFNPLCEPSLRAALTIEGGEETLQAYLSSLPPDA